MFLTVTTMLQNIANSVIRLNGLVVPLDIKFDQFREKVDNDLQMLRDSMDSLNHSISNLSTCLQEHKQQTQSEIISIKTSLNSTQALIDKHTLGISYKLDALNSTMNIFGTIIRTSLKEDVECMDVQQGLQLHQYLHDNVALKLEEISSCLGCYTCGGTGGWRRVVYLNMTDLNTTCPSGWNMTGFTKRVCGRVSTEDNTCDSAIFPLTGGQYSRICGRILAYQWGQPDAFGNKGRSINEAYACGVSVTHGRPRNHIWTFAAGVSEGGTGSITSYHACPCDATVAIKIPPFVGNDYFCESGVNEPYDNCRHRLLHINDTLWDGEDCLPSSTCCSLHNPPYFVKQLPTSTTDDIEARICVDDTIRDATLQ